MSENISFDFSIGDIEFKGKSLLDWTSQFTINIPGVHMTNQQAQKIIIDLNNKYHLAYNCYNELLISYGNVEQEFISKKSIVMKSMVESLRSDGAGRIPAKEVLSEMAITSNNELKELNQKLMLLDIIKTFFENNKTKLEKSMQLIINLSYMISASDKMHFKSGEPYL